MSSVFSWIKKQIGYLFNSIPEILKGFILFILIISGIGIAILLRLVDQGGILIASVSITIEVFAMVAIYFLFRKYLKPEEEIKTVSVKKK